jgi:glycosyltransferase involved in cell wall biosynthesis
VSKISVIIPVYNRGLLIGETLLSLLNQSVPAYEIIVVDDGSTDATVDVVRTTYDNWKNKQLNHHSTPSLLILTQSNKGAGAARNLAFRHAHGDFIHFFDSDDLASENKHEAQLRALEYNNGDIVFSPWVKFSTNGSKSQLIDLVLQQALPDHTLSLVKWWLRGWSTVMQSMLFRKSFLDQIPLFREDMPSHQDSELMTRVLLANPKVSFAHDALTLYRVHNYGNITPFSNTRQKSRAVDRARFLILAEDKREKHGIKLDLVTKSAFFYSIYQAYIDLAASSSCLTIELEENLRRLIPRWPASLFKAYELFKRLSTRIRYSLTGTRYIIAMKASEPTLAQQKAIIKLFTKYSIGESLDNGLSVIIPTYNRADLIPETLLSVLNQTIPADEIIVVDDGSTDDTSEVVLQVANNWKLETGNLKPEIKVIRKENAGPAAARNVGFAASKGAFIHFFDSDDLAAPNKHEIQLKALFESGADIAYGPWVKGQICEGKFTRENHVLQQKGLPSNNSSDLIKALLANWSIVAHACLFRRSIVEKSGGFPGYLFFGEDQLMFLNCLLAGARVVHSPGTLELYRTEDVSKLTATGAGQKRHALDWSRFLVDADKVCQQHGISPREWIGFRRRVWESILDLQKFGISDQELLAGLNQILGNNTSASLYRFDREIDRKWLGLKSRITGGRANSSFKSGPITKEQKQLIEQMGLHLEESCASCG